MSITFAPGKYRGRITKWGLGKANTGNPQFVVSFELVGQYQNGNLASCSQFERSVFRVITDNTIDFLVSDLEKLGYPHETFDQLDPNHPQAHDFAGVEVDVQCKHETYEGVTREKWAFAWGGGATINPLERSDVSKLNAMFGKRLKATKPAARPQTAGATKTTEEEASEVF